MKTLSRFIRPLIAGLLISTLGACAIVPLPPPHYHGHGHGYEYRPAPGYGYGGPPPYRRW